MFVVKEGYPYILVLGAFGALGVATGFFWIGGVLLFLAIFVTFFFRDPERIFQGSSHEVVSPADGKVVLIRKEQGSEVLSIFLSIFDVHINRAPVSGTISGIEYKKGKFLLAFDERASLENEQNAITIDHGGRSIRFVQIAGLIARRIVCWRRQGEVLSAGERIGLIKFGSRVDLYLPEGSRLKVQLGQRVKAGETVIGEIV